MQSTDCCRSAKAPVLTAGLCAARRRRRSASPRGGGGGGGGGFSAAPTIPPAMAPQAALARFAAMPPMPAPLVAGMPLAMGGPLKPGVQQRLELLYNQARAQPRAALLSAACRARSPAAALRARRPEELLGPLHASCMERAWQNAARLPGCVPLAAHEEQGARAQHPAAQREPPRRARRARWCAARWTARAWTRWALWTRRPAARRWRTWRAPTSAASGTPPPSSWASSAAWPPRRRCCRRARPARRPTDTSVALECGPAGPADPARTWCRVW